MRAIILAAGMGTRLRPITLKRPKSLIDINGQTLVERQIQFLKEKGIDDIVVVVGYLAEQFEFLTDKYQVRIVNNPHYATFNNFYSMYLVKDYLEDAYVIDADNYLFDNIFETSLKRSTYFGVYRENCPEEWFLITGSKDTITEIKVGGQENGIIMSGISFWSRQTAEKIRIFIEDRFHLGHYQNIYWDDIVKEHIEALDIQLKEIAGTAIYEIDNLEDYQELVRRTSCATKSTE